MCCRFSEEFKTKADRDRHMRRDHRGAEHAPERKPRHTPHTIPDGATELQFGRMWKVGDRLPESFALRHLPLIRVGYTHEFLRVPRQICCYMDVRARYARELLEFFMAHTTYVRDGSAPNMPIVRRPVPKNEENQPVLQK